MSSNIFTLISQTNPSITATLSYQNDGTVLYTYINSSTCSYEANTISFYQLMPWMPLGQLITPTAPAKGSTIGSFQLGFSTLYYDTARFTSGDFAKQLNTFLNGVQSASVPVYMTSEQLGSLVLTSSGLQYQLASGSNGSYNAPQLQWTLSLADLKTASISVTDKTFSIQGQQNYLYSPELFPFAPLVSSTAKSSESIPVQNMTALLQTFISAVSDAFVSSNIISLSNSSADTVTLGLIEEKTTGALPYDNPINRLGNISAGQSCLVIAALGNNFVVMQSNSYPLAYVDSGLGIASAFSINSQTNALMSAANTALQNVLVYPSSTLAKAFTNFTTTGGNWLMYQFELSLQSSKDTTNLADILTLLGYQSSQLQAWAGTYYLYDSQSKNYLTELVIGANNQVSYNGHSLSNVTFSAPSSSSAAVLEGTTNGISISINFFWYPPSGAIDTQVITKACSGSITQNKQTTTVNGYAKKITSSSSSDTLDKVLAWSLSIGGLLAYLYEIYKYIKGQSPQEPDPKDVEALEQKAAAVREQIYQQALENEASVVEQGLNAEVNQLVEEDSEGYQVTTQEQEAVTELDAINNDVPQEKPVDASQFNQDAEHIQSLADDANNAVEVAQQGLEAEYDSQTAIYQQAKALDSQAKAESKQIEQSMEDAEDDMDGDGEGIDDDLEADIALKP